jgi:hypothetical protein
MEECMHPEIQDQIEQWFTYHAPAGDDPMHYTALREAGNALARTIAEHTPRCADQSAAIRKVREAVMTANAAVACKGI